MFALALMLFVGVMAVLINQVAAVPFNQGNPESPGSPRFFEFQHTATIATGTVLLPVNQGGDIQGTDRWLYGIRSEAGVDLQRIHLESNGWGRRVIEIPPVGQFAAITGKRTHRLPYLMHVPGNQSVDSFATQNAVGAQAVTFDLLYLQGNLPVSTLKNAVRPMHSEIFQGIATSGSFPSLDAPTASVILLKEYEGQLWVPIRASMNSLAAASEIPDGQLRHPRDNGGGPHISGIGDVYSEPNWEQLAFLSEMAGGDTISLLARDDAGAAVVAYLMLVDTSAAPPMIDTAFINASA